MAARIISAPCGRMRGHFCSVSPAFHVPEDQLAARLSEEEACFSSTDSEGKFFFHGLMPMRDGMGDGSVCQRQRLDVF